MFYDDTSLDRGWHILLDFEHVLYPISAGLDVAVLLAVIRTSYELWRLINKHTWLGPAFEQEIIFLSRTTKFVEHQNGWVSRLE